jgi:hypothetical protein
VVAGSEQGFVPEEYSQEWFLQGLELCQSCQSWVLALGFVLPMILHRQRERGLLEEFKRNLRERNFSIAAVLCSNRSRFSTGTVAATVLRMATCESVSIIMVGRLCVLRD